MKTAVVLFNLGAPSGKNSIKPFLLNLFSDPAILPLPNPWRKILAWMIAQRRAPKAREIYSFLGGSSPLLKNTQDQARSLERELGPNHRVFVCMRYWHPRAEKVMQEIKEYQPDSLVLLPLYPQFSSTTTASSLREFQEIQEKQLPQMPVRVITSFFQEPGFISAWVDLIKAHLMQIKTPFRILFTAHGLPERTLKKGDPYQSQIEETVKAILKMLNDSTLDHRICYQSKIGPIPWIKPFTDEEIDAAFQDNKSVLLVPISFVSENSETLVELDIFYQKKVEKTPHLHLVRTSTLSTHPSFMKGLAGMVLDGRK
jgi:ferrochelatase